jgi:hypothetical protein
MDEKFQSILESLPKKSPRSRLEPYQDLINELRRRGRTYREIERILVEQCHVETSRSAINDFVRVRSRKKTLKRQAGGSSEANAIPPLNRETPSSDEVYRRIAELKRRPTPQQTTPEIVFHYNPDEPLHILPKTEKRKED